MTLAQTLGGMNGIYPKFFIETIQTTTKETD